MAKKLASNEIADLVDRIGPALLAFAAMSSDSPEDIVQEAFCQLVRNSREVKKPEAWLFQVVRNLVRQSHRSKTRRLKREHMAALPIVQHSALEFDADARLAADSMQQLPDELREVVVLRLWADLTFEEIAEMTQSSTTTVHRKYNQAIDSLKRILSDVPARQ